jgi:hypothetical protein
MLPRWQRYVAGSLTAVASLIRSGGAQPAPKQLEPTRSRACVAGEMCAA